MSAIGQSNQLINDLHGCVARHRESINVTEKFKDEVVWEGIVHIFDLTAQPETDKCYTWSSPIEGSEMRKFYVVLHIPPVDSSEKAVHASIVQDFREKIKLYTCRN